MALPVKITFTTVSEAKAHHEKVGGVLLSDPGCFSVCSCLPIHWKKCECNRTPKHIASLAPSWDETHPDNAAAISHEHQQELF